MLNSIYTKNMPICYTKNMAEKKHSVLALLKIFIEHSDMEHLLTVKDIQRYLDVEYGIKLERRTVYSNIDMLRAADYQISEYGDNGRGYYLENKQFEKGEVLLLCNIIHASHLISKKESKILIDKLLKTISKYERKEYVDNVYLQNEQKVDVNQLQYNMDLISSAIKDHYKIHFTYNHYDANKKLIPTEKSPYTIEPRYIVYCDSRPYLIGTDLKHYDFVHYRMDRITDATIIEEVVKPISKKDAYEYAKNMLFMFSGEKENIVLRCKNNIIDHMIDMFGKDCVIIPKDDNTFELRINANPRGIKILAQQYIDSMVVMEPKSLKEEIKEIIKKAMNKYR